MDRRAVILAQAVAMVALGLATAAQAHPHRFTEQQVMVSVSPVAVMVQAIIAPSPTQGPTVVALIDRNGDGVLSAEEGQYFATALMSEVTLTSDGAPLTLQEIMVALPSPQNIAEGTAHVTVSAMAPLTVQRGPHDLTFAITYSAFAQDWFIQPWTTEDLLPEGDYPSVERATEGNRLRLRYDRG